VKSSYKSWSAHHLVPPSYCFFLLGPNILLGSLFPYILDLYSSLRVRNQVSHPYKITFKIIYFKCFNIPSCGMCLIPRSLLVVTRFSSGSATADVQLSTAQRKLHSGSKHYEHSNLMRHLVLLQFLRATQEAFEIYSSLLGCLFFMLNLFPADPPRPTVCTQNGFLRNLILGSFATKFEPF
jgi:hypothetical protein